MAMGWIGKLLLIQVTSIVGTIVVVAIVNWILPFGVMATVSTGVLISGLLFVTAAYRTVEWDTISSSVEHDL